MRRLIVLLVATASAGVASAQEHHHNARQDAAVDESMSGHVMASKHLVKTPARPPTHADSARAAEVVATLERTIAQYRDPADAERDGFKRFLPNVKTQRIFHYTKASNAIGAAFRFDPAAPTSLLYRPDGHGKLVLLGAMYSAPARVSEDELNRRFPLSIASWHRHVNLCLPKKGEEQRWLEKRDGKMLFGPEGSIATEADCADANGRFVPALFGWMLHVETGSSGLGGDHPAS